eukprot:TRINITY_DN14235_c1_g2_i2.p3 TRINITY_DN14235_c1_g2~~TRINITY_DN14235_c1_g2_i2.p3  ORF type:complete len:105 (+),score=19.19 TRINITY_DN14235_c1_g2_i2:1262-1576(+)
MTSMEVDAETQTRASPSRSGSGAEPPAVSNRTAGLKATPIPAASSTPPFYIQIYLDKEFDIVHNSIQDAQKDITNLGGRFMKVEAEVGNVKDEVETVDRRTTNA